MAFVAHALLVLALAWGVAWQQTPVSPTVQAELWAQLPAMPSKSPPPSAPPAPPTQPVATQPTRAPKPLPAAPGALKNNDMANKQADIALQRQKQLQAQRDKQAEQQALREKQKQQDKQRQQEKEKEQEKKLQEEKAKKAALNKAQTAQTTAEKPAKKTAPKDQLPPTPTPAKPTTAASKTKAESTNKTETPAADDAIAAAARASERLEQLKRKAQGTELGGTNANSGSGGTSRLSKDYESRIFSAVGKIWAPDVKGNPTVDVTVKALPDGTMTSVTISRPSGQPAWDDAVVAAIKAIRKLPADANGHIPPHITLVYSPLEKR
jgi:colicin import membrane protein